MLSGWTRVLILCTAVMLLANAQCYGACGAIACKSPQVPASSCHHKSPPQDKGCSHRHAEFAAPQSTMVNVDPVHDAGMAAIAAHPFPAFEAHAFALPAHDESPPGKPTFYATSVLRV
jgi:hypothetical protein